ncbi:iron-containing redox enzyme family protein [Lentzea flaviverrucosa]|uniref:Iron-containing redox enzyme n=1 Tax=Lentzea flaviverrucosa TaxID=200379 RepID=A0A1H9A371_9PSEU|nr:iron-containing redox enzyme family protein [Lentzea flaviverrucosa]RDI32176.1 heme oxygenase-like protein [Lentzea flaviverrucosa]SEP71172.1 Iron-containing redox enzyme [Lentzea flaviverrucosa]
MHLPSPRGPLSEQVVATLKGDPDGRAIDFSDADPYGEDLTIALHTLYELHYGGFDGVHPAWEWDPELLRLRARIENVFLERLRSDVDGGEDLDATLGDLLVEHVPGSGVSHHLRDDGTWDQMCEYFAHRSVYHHKEADPHAWVIPRLRGRAKAALVAVEFDEFGGGRADRMHSRLYADLLDGAGMSSDYLHYLDDVPAPAIAIVNMMSLFGLHRSLRGALVGHFAAAEITTAPSARRMTQALERLGADPRCVEFFTEHIEADAVHEQIMRNDVIGSLLEQEPSLRADVVFGVQATELLESRLAAHLLSSWDSGESSLRTRLRWLVSQNG